MYKNQIDIFALSHHARLSAVFQDFSAVLLNADVFMIPDEQSYYGGNVIKQSIEHEVDKVKKIAVVCQSSEIISSTSKIQI